MKEFTCPRCGGQGHIEKYNHVEAGICFECSGSGKVTEEELQRIEKDIAKEVKKGITQKQKLVDSLKKEWFNNSNIIYIVNNNNTYPIRSELKNAGAKYNKHFNIWYFTENKTDYPLFTITWNEVLNDNNKGYAVNMTNLIKTKSNGNLKGY